MCGIVGLLIKNPARRAELGAWMTPILVAMGARGPDSAGLAVFTDPLSGAERKFSVSAPDWRYDWSGFETACIEAHGAGAEIGVLGNHAVVRCAASAADFKPWVRARFPDLHVLSAGRAIDIYKDVGHPRDIAARYRFGALAGTHLVGHTRMATESAVTPAHAHPFTAGEDFCLVHNGSLSNPNSVRRRLEHQGIAFETDNDTEAACRFLEWRMREGDGLETALRAAFTELDGFYTLLIGTRDKLALVRDAFACKPAVVAETEDYVAISSEFRGLAHLPGIENASLFEPMPEEIYAWKV